MVLQYACPGEAAMAGRWATRLGISCLGPQERPCSDLTLELASGVLSLRDNRGRRLKPLVVDFDARAAASRKQSLGRAVGRRTRTLVDATAGWGEDTRRLYAMGCVVTVVERNPVMAALLDNAAGRAARFTGTEPPRVVAADAIEYLAAHPDGWDCVYMDPMFPPKRRSSTLAKRRMRLLRELVGDDPDRERLFAAAMRAARGRVVVKRPDHHPPVFGRPGHSVNGKLVSYDIYFQ